MRDGVTVLFLCCVWIESLNPTVYTQRQQCQHRVCMCEHSTLCSCFPRGSLSRVCVWTRAWCVMPSFPQVLFSTTSHILKARRMIAWPEWEEWQRRREGGLGWEWEFLFFIPQRLIPDSSTLIFPSSPEVKQAVGTVSSKAGVKERPASRSRTMARENIHRANIKLLWSCSRFVSFLLFCVYDAFCSLPLLFFLSPFEKNENNNLLLISCFLLFLVFYFWFFSCHSNLFLNFLFSLFPSFLS